MLKKLHSVSLITLIVFSFFMSGTSSVHAQAVSFEDNEELQNLYRDEIGAYRDSERTFEVSKEQYFKLTTLKALEQAVSGTRNVLLARSKVLITYIEILKNELELQHGVNLVQKDAALELLSTQLTYLKSHQDAVLLANDRDAIASAVANFKENQPNIEDAVYRARTLIAIGKVQTVNDKARALLEDIKKEHAKEEVTSLVASKRDRAYTETTKHIDQTEAAVIKIIDQDYSRTTNQFNKSRFNQLSAELSEPYITAQKTLGFLDELLKL